MGEIEWCFYSFLSWRKGNVYVEMIQKMKNRFVSIFTFMQYSCTQCRGTPLLTSQKIFLKIFFLQKLVYQKPCWYHARLSSLVNEQVSLNQPTPAYFSLFQFFRKSLSSLSSVSYVSLYYLLRCVPMWILKASVSA